MVLFVLPLLTTDFRVMLVIFLAQIPLVAYARVLRKWARTAKMGVLFAVFIAVTNFFFGMGPEHSVAMALRFMALLTTSSFFFLTTSPDDFGLALEQMGVPYSVCFVFTAALRFVPVMAREIRSIMDAQMSRGLELQKGNLIKRAKNFIPVLIPLFIMAIRRSIEMAEAMESKAFGFSKKRTHYRELEWKLRDSFAVLGSLCCLIAFIVASMHY